MRWGPKRRATAIATAGLVLTVLVSITTPNTSASSAASAVVPVEVAPALLAENPIPDAARIAISTSTARIALATAGAIVVRPLDVDVRQTLPTPSSAVPSALTFSSQTGALWFIDNGTLWRGSGTDTDWIALPVGGDVALGLAADPVSDDVFVVVQRAPDQVAIQRWDANGMLAQINLGHWHLALPASIPLAVSPDGTVAVVALNGGELWAHNPVQPSELRSVNLETGTLLGIAEFDPWASAITASPNGAAIAVASAATGRVAVYGATTLEPILDEPGFDQPAQLAFTADSAALAVSHAHGTDVLPLSGSESERANATIHLNVGTECTGAAVSSENVLWTGCAADDPLSAFQLTPASPAVTDGVAPVVGAALSPGYAELVGTVGASAASTGFEWIGPGEPRYSIEPALPSGLTLDPATGAISGTLEDAVWGWFRVSATDDIESASRLVLVDVHPRFAEVMPDILTTEGMTVDQPIGELVGFGGPVTVTVSPDLPNDLILEADGRARGFARSSVPTAFYQASVSWSYWTESITMSVLINEDGLIDGGGGEVVVDPPPLLPVPSVTVVIAPPDDSSSTRPTSSPSPGPGGSTAGPSPRPSERATLEADVPQAVSPDAISALIAAGWVLGISVLAALAAFGSLSFLGIRRRP